MSQHKSLLIWLQVPLLPTKINKPFCGNRNPFLNFIDYDMFNQHKNPQNGTDNQINRLLRPITIPIRSRRACCLWGNIASLGDSMIASTGTRAFVVKSTRCDRSNILCYFQRISGNNHIDGFTHFNEWLKDDWFCDLFLKRMDVWVSVSW